MAISNKVDPGGEFRFLGRARRAACAGNAVRRAARKGDEE